MTRFFRIFTLALLTGCASQIPVPANHPLSYQQKAKSVHHWDVLAKDVATQVKQAMHKEAQLQDKPFYIDAPPGETPFDRAFRSLLITRLVESRVPLSRKSEGAIVLEFNTQIIRHNSYRYAHIPGTFTALASGIWVVRDLLASSASAVPVSLGAAGLADYGMGQYAGPATASELMITTSISMDNSYLYRKADIYYLEDADVKLYESSNTIQGDTKKWEVTGK